MSTSSTRPFAVVTGASTGIGRELAKQFATNGFDLLVTAENAELTAAADEVRGLGATVEAVQVDLTAEGGVDELYARIQAAGRPVDAIAINAGIGGGGSFAGPDSERTDLDQELQIVDLNVRSTVHLAKHVIADMVANDHGRVLFTSSIASTMPGAFQAVYNASKSFVQSFALAVRDEVKDTNVTVTSLMPGPVDTEFFKKAGMLDTKVGAGDKDDPADVARHGFEAMMNGDERVVSASMKSKLQGRAGRFMPDSVKAQMHRKMSEPGSGNGGVTAASKRQPIKVEGHSLIDYAFFAAAIGGPLTLGLKGRARAIPFAFGATQGTLNALTDQPYALKRVVPFKLHGRGESLAVPVLAVAILASGALDQPKAKPYFAGLLATLGTVYALTDWDAQPER